MTIALPIVPLIIKIIEDVKPFNIQGLFPARRIVRAGFV